MEFMGGYTAKMTAIAKIRPGKRKEFLNAMRSLLDDKLKEKGVTASKWHEDRQDPTYFYLTDEWESEEDLKRYCSTDSFRIFLGALKTLCVDAEVKYGPFHGEAGSGIVANFSWEKGRVAET